MHGAIRRDTLPEIVASAVRNLLLLAATLPGVFEEQRRAAVGPGKEEGRLLPAALGQLLHQLQRVSNQRYSKTT